MKYTQGKNPNSRNGFQKGHFVSEETKKKISGANKGKKLSEEHKKKLSAAKLKNPVRYWKNKYRDDKTKEKIREKLWKGGYELRLLAAKHRRVMKLGNGGIHTLGEWQTLKAQYNWTCPCCYKSEPEIKLTEDHIIPISKGGSDNIENIQPLCSFCNNSKHTKIIKYKL